VAAREAIGGGVEQGSASDGTALCKIQVAHLDRESGCAACAGKGRKDREVPCARGDDPARLLAEVRPG